MRVEVEGLRAHYGNEVLFGGESFELSGPGLILVIGPNGAGKTTLMRALLGLVRIDGKVFINGVDVTGRPERAGKFVGYVPQIGPQDLAVPISVMELLSPSLRSKLPKGSERLREIVDLLGLREVLNLPFSSLSGGQRQRVLLARALAPDPPILMMDEPISSIDPAGRETIIDLILDLSEEKLLILSSHDPALFANHSKEVIALNKRIVSIGPPEDVLNEKVMREVYGRSLILVERCLHVVDYHGTY